MLPCFSQQPLWLLSITLSRLGSWHTGKLLYGDSSVLVIAAIPSCAFPSVWLVFVRSLVISCVPVEVGDYLLLLLLLLCCVHLFPHDYICTESHVNLFLIFKGLILLI